MKQCDRSLSPFTIGSSSLSFAPSESDPADSFWGDFNFDFSFLTSEDQKTGIEYDADDDLPDLSLRANVTKVEESKLYGLAAYELRKNGDFARPVRENSDSFLKLPHFLESDLKCVDSKLSLSLAVDSTSHFDFNVNTSKGKISQHNAPTTSVPEVTSITPVAKSGSVDNDNSSDALCTMDKSASLGKFLVRKDLSQSTSSPFFYKAKKNMCSANRIILSEKSSMCIDQDDTEVDSPSGRGTQSPDNVVSAIKSFNFRRSSNDPNGLHGLNPLAPHFIPSNAEKTLDKKGRVFKENKSSSLKESLSSSFRLSSGEFGITDHFEAGIEQGSDQNNKIGIQIYDGGESLGLASQDSECKTMSILDISDEFQKSRKLDPLAPVFVPSCTKLNGKHGATDHIIAIDTNVNSTSALSSSDSMLGNVKVATHSSEVNHSIKNHYSNNVHEWGKTYSFNPQLGSQVENSENTKLNSSSNKIHVRKKLNPLAPQFLLADTRKNVYGYEGNQAATDLRPMVNSSVLVSPTGYRSHKELHAGLAHSSGQQTDDRHDCSTTSSSPKLDVKKLLMTIHGLSELLTHVHSSETSDSPNEECLDLINCTVQNLNSYIDNRVQEHTGKYARAVHSSCDLNSFSYMRQRSVEDHQLPKANNKSANTNIKRKEKYSMVSRDMVPDSHLKLAVSKEIGFGKDMIHHQTEELIDPQVLFYKSLCLKAKADKSIMEYETLLSRTST